MKNKYGLLPILVSTVLMSLLFYMKAMGLNLLVFEAFLIAWLAFTKQLPFHSTMQRLLFAGFVATGIATVFVSSTFGYVMHFVLFFILTGYWVWPRFNSLIAALLQAIVNFFHAQWAFLKKVLVVRLNGKSLGYYLRKAGIIIVPLIAVLIFFNIYRNSNPLFEQWTGNIGRFIAEKIELFIEYLDTPLFATVFWSFIFSNFLLFRHFNPSITETDALQLEDATRKRRQGILGFKTNSLKSEHKAALIMLAALNALLLVMNISDIKLVWLGFEWEGQYLKQFVHEGTYLLIFSILISIGIVLYFFRGNLNFYKKNKLLKQLSYAWLAQNALLAISVAIRNYWYISYYALAYKRIGVLIFLILTLYGLYTVYRKVSKRKTSAYLFRVNFNAILVVLSLSSFVDWDTTIARYNFGHAGKSFVHFAFLADLSDKTLPILDKPLAELEQIKQAQQSFAAERHDIRPGEYYDVIQERKADFVQRWEKKTLLEWNWPEYKAWKTLTTKTD